ncbi:hypothetical protein C882_3843 [Caenispirillum salinarum AK4]|uniref:Uncharacterized protein n=1 Tax=Caenispirillum salinarum AK4 TaxID=1238182 RepID=K9GZQ6_9PROT|nr:hypothetical protein [Caenispirillum salinarum]EKV31470.1 hypothetical protein C882_3843 [Caenispirillum salinarum AK4]
MPLYNVVWKSAFSGATGVLSSPVGRYLAEFRAAQERRAQPHMTWWVEPAAYR